MECLFCRANGPFSTVEHIVPESLGNTELTISGHVCDSCQAYFGKEVEQFVLSKTPLGFWRVLLGIPTKKGKPPFVDLAQPASDKGSLPSRSAYHDDGIAFASHEDGSVSVDVRNSKIVQEIIARKRTQFRFVLTPKHLAMMGRFLGKIALETLCLHDSPLAKMGDFNALRDYVRFGVSLDLWPMFHASWLSFQDFNRLYRQGRVDFSEGRIQQYGSKYWLFSLRLATDFWIICMNDQYPNAEIRAVYADLDLELIWYESKSWKRRS